MMTQTSPERIRQDGRQIGQTLLKLALPRLVLRAIVLVIAAVIWLLVSSWLLSFGKTMSFDNLQSLGQQTVELLTRINPYVWWGVVVLWSLIVFFSARGWLYASLAHGRMRVVPATELAALRARLSPEVVDVLRWVWGERDEPFTIGDLQRSHQEVRRNRIGKIALVREQSAILDQAGIPAEAVTPAAAGSGRSEPGMARSRPAGEATEPHLSPYR